MNQQVLQRFENALEHFRTFLEQACHNQMDDGETMAARIGGIMKAPKNTCMAVSILLSSWTVSRYVTQFQSF